MAVTFIEGGGSGPGTFDPVVSAAPQGGAMYNGSRSGSVDVDLTVKEHGYSSMICAATATPASAYVGRNAVLGATRRISVRCRFSGAMGTSSSPGTGFIRVNVAATTEAFTLTVNNAGLVRLANVAAVLGTSSGAALTLGQWYRFAISYTITNTTTYTINVYQDGVLIINAVNAGAIGSAAPTDLRIGWTGTVATANAVLYFQDVYVDDTAGNADPGDVRVAAKKPAALGATNAFSTLVGAGSNRWDYIAERPRSTTNRITHTTATVVREQFAVEAAEVGDDNLTGSTILDWAGWTYFAIAASAGSALATPVVAGADKAYTTVAATGVYQVTYHLAASATYPTANTAIGLKSSGTAILNQLAECGVYVAYILPDPPPHRRAPMFLANSVYQR